MNKKDRIIARIKKASDFLERDVWKIPLKDLPIRKSFLIKQIRIFMLAIRGFREHEILLHASALTYYTLLAIVPIVAMAFGIAKGFGLDAYLESQLREVFAGREDVFNWVMEFSSSMLQTTQGGVVAGVGLLVLLYTIIIVLVYVEESFNLIWQIKHSRPMARKVSDYFAMMFVTPLFLMLSSAAMVYLTTQLSNVFVSLQVLNFLSPAFIFFINLIPYVLIWITFMLLYMVMPNTNVKIGSALIGAVVAGTAFILTQWVYLHFQIGVSRYNAIYGSFAALPLLLFWLRISWLIVLFGAELSYANQNVDHYEFEYEAKNISPYNRKLLSLYLYNIIAKRFAIGETPLTPPQMSVELEMPINLVRQVLDDLKETGFVNETLSVHHKENAYQPATDINKVDIRQILEKLDKKGVDALIVRPTPELDELKKTIHAFNVTLASAPQNKLIKDI